MRKTIATSLPLVFIASTVSAHLMCQSLGIKFRDANKAFQDAKKAHADQVAKMTGMQLGTTTATQMNKGPGIKGSIMLLAAPSSERRKLKKLDREQKQKARELGTARRNYQYCEREHKKLHITFPEKDTDVYTI